MKFLKYFNIFCKRKCSGWCDKCCPCFGDFEHFVPRICCFLGRFRYYRRGEEVHYWSKALKIRTITIIILINLPLLPDHCHYLMLAFHNLSFCLAAPDTMPASFCQASSISTFVYLLKKQGSILKTVFVNVCKSILFEI